MEMSGNLDSGNLIGEHTRPRVTFGALAKGGRRRPAEHVFGEGSENHTRGRVCSPCEPLPMEMSGNFEITLNGAAHRLESPLSLAALLESIGLAGKPVVIELNEQAVFPRDIDSTIVKAGTAWKSWRLRRAAEALKRDVTWRRWEWRRPRAPPRRASGD